MKISLLKEDILDIYKYKIFFLKYSFLNLLSKAKFLKNNKYM